MNFDIAIQANWLVSLVGIFIIIVYCLKQISAKRERQSQEAFARRHGCLLPPRMHNNRPWGLDHLEASWRADKEFRLNELFLYYFRQTANTMIHCFLGTTAFSTIDPANIEAILSTKFEDFDSGKRRDIMIPLLGHGIFTLNGEAWRHSRNMLREPVQYRHYENLDVFKEAIDDLIGILSRQTGVIDLEPLFFSLTLDVSTAFLFGESVRSLRETGSGTGQAFTDAFNSAFEVLAWRFRLPDLAWMIEPFRFRKACNGVHHFADQIIDRNLSSQKAKKNASLLDLMAERMSDRNVLKGQILNLLAAGRDATACMLTWTFFLLLRHPPVLAKMREEIKPHCPDPAVLTRKDLKKIKYVDCVMREALRLYPSVPVNDRKANKDTFLPTGGGPDRTAPVMIPKGATVAYSVYALHRRPDLYGMDAELFRPERWEEELPMSRDKTLQKWGYLPFNGGPRICIGLDFALTEVAYTIVRLLLHFPDMRLPEGQRVELTGVEKQNVTFVISPKEGCVVDIAPKNQPGATQPVEVESFKPKESEKLRHLEDPVVVYF